MIKELKIYKSSLMVDTIITKLGWIEFPLLILFDIVYAERIFENILILIVKVSLH